MKARIQGRIDSPVAALVGAWDPFLPGHVELFRKLARYARMAQLTPMAVLLDPHPASFLQKGPRWSVFDTAQTRLAFLRACGVRASLTLRFDYDDLTCDARDFFEIVTTHVELAQLWLGARQTLGSGPAGSSETIAALARQYGVQVRRLGESSETLTAGTVRRLLGEGRLLEAVKTVGRPPTRTRPLSGNLTLAWQPGDYLAVPLDDPDGDGPPLRVSLVDVDEGRGSLDWPDPNIEKLGFIAGPADSITRARAS